MKKSISIFILLIVIVLIYFYWHAVICFLQAEWREILTTIIGGSIGGLITYLYVIHTENKREARAIRREHERDEQERKEKCTRSLLSTQMAIIIQMNTSKGLEVLANSILSFNLMGKTLEQHLKNIPRVSGKAAALYQLINDANYPIQDLISLTDHILVCPAATDLISLPYEIFEISTMLIGKKIIIPELACYFQKLVSCNKKYTDIISLIMRNNEIRDLVVNQPISQMEAGMSTRITGEELNKYLMVIAAMFTLALNLKEMTTKYLDDASNVLLQTARYIELLGISQPIQAKKDKDGKIIFDKA